MLHRSFEHGTGSAGSANKSGDWSDGWFDDEDDPQCQVRRHAAACAQFHALVTGREGSSGNI
jgi:hypothetical protein